MSADLLPPSSPFAFDSAKFALIVLAAIFASSLSELINYFLLYRKADYRTNKSNPTTTQPKSRSSTRSWRS
jgi:hypothetical protein